MATTNEQIYFDALKRITKYQTVPQLQRSAGKDYGLEWHEALEYAYENLIQEAKTALRGKRAPKGKVSDEQGK